jgi:hypothetical protein
MDKKAFESYLEEVTRKLRKEAKAGAFRAAKDFEVRVRDVTREVLQQEGIAIDAYPHPQAFPDISIGQFGIEVKFTLNDEWRSVANSVLETNRDHAVLYVYVVFAKMGGVPDVKWRAYEESVMHVRTSHVPRFEVQIDAAKSLFEIMGITYEEFRLLAMSEKMRHIRRYARSRLKKGERLWWLEDDPDAEHSLPIQARLFTELQSEEKIKLRAEAIILCPQILKSGRSRNKYDDVALFLLTYHGVLCHQARDLFSAGSVGNPQNDDEGGLYISRMLALMEPELEDAAQRLEASLFEEYWGENVAPSKRMKHWIQKADHFAQGRWRPSEELFNGRYRNQSSS